MTDKMCSDTGIEVKENINVPNPWFVDLNRPCASVITKRGRTV